MDHNIKSMYQLMAKCEELSKSMGPVYKLAEQMRVLEYLFLHLYCVFQFYNHTNIYSFSQLLVKR